MEKKYPNTKWHRILLLTHQSPNKAEQRLRLADGLKDSQATHLLLEFKYTESLNEDALIQLLGFGYFYQNSQKLKASEIDLFCLSSKTPKTKTLRFFGYDKTQCPGVYNSEYALVRRVVLLVLNELSDEPYNVALKCFASRTAEVAKTYEIIDQQKMPVSVKIGQIFLGLKPLLLRRDHDMSSDIKELTPEYLIEKGKVFLDTVLEQMPAEALLKKVSTEKRLEGISNKERLQGIPAKDLLKGLAASDLKALSSDEREKLMSVLKAGMKNDD